MAHSIRYGLRTALGLILYFLLMKILGLETNFFLRIFNFFILIGGTYLMLRSTVASGRPFSYLEGLAYGFTLTITSVVTFLLFMALYTGIIDPNFVAVLESSGMWGSQLTLQQAAFAIFIEGMASGAIISFSWMQYFKKYAARTL